MQVLPDGQRRGFNTLHYTSHEIRRVARAAFDLAATRSGRVCSVDKANAIETSEVWRAEVTRLHREEFPGIELSHMYVDNCAMQLVRSPRQFDVIVTENLFGDILSDCASMVTGSLGLLPSASIGERGPDGLAIRGLYEPVHGSAPDIAGRGVANPYATLLSLAMLFETSFGLFAEAGLLRGAIAACLERKVWTPDLGRSRAGACTTAQVGDAVVQWLSTHRGVPTWS
jgi:3-isopropylmalate dehydrogenase